MKPSSSYLQPQVLVNNPLNELTKKPFYAKQEQAMQEILSDLTLPDDWDDFIHTVTTEQIANEVIQPNPTNPYLWKKEANKIHILINENNSQHLSESDFQITSKSIHSPIISGDFLYPVSNSTVTRDGNGALLITLDFDSKMEQLEWPVLISGGDADPFSSFILAHAALSFNQYFLFFYWALKSGTSGYTPAKRSLGSAYFALKKVDESIFWFAQYAIETHDNFSQVVVSQYLIESNPPDCDPILAENILINAAKQGFQDAFYELGYLHLQKLPNWNNDEKLALQYLHESADKFKDDTAMELLARCYQTGVGCNKDLNKAEYYSKLSKGENIKDQTNDHSNTIASLTVSIGAIAGTAFLGYYLFKKLFKK